MKQTNLLAVVWMLVIFGTASHSWALGIPGFPAMNTAFGLISAFVIAIIEAYLVIQLMFMLARMHQGVQGEKEKVIWVLVAIFLVPFAPSIASYLYGLFFQSGATPSSGVWNGQ